MDFSISGPKDVACLNLGVQLAGAPEGFQKAMIDLVTSLPGEQVSVSGSASSTATGKAGSFTISGSSWSA